MDVEWERLPMLKHQVLRTFLVCLVMAMTGLAAASSSNDPHGGIPMGQQNTCDNGEANIEIDWNPNSADEHTCDGPILRPGHVSINTSCEEETLPRTHVCYPEQIFYNDKPPTSGSHRPNWPAYGEYKYIPPQRWLHSLEHGAIVMLYHPCADPDEVEKLRQEVTQCLRRHVITPYKDLPPSTPLGLLSWGCKLLMNQTLPTEARHFVRTHALRGPESVAADGSYNKTLIVRAQTVSDFLDSRLCLPEPDQAA